ncbi:hypothetical protein [Rickettsia endosymbiont of Gonocerus acuteangulatus]
MLIPPYYAASGGEYTQKRLNWLIINQFLQLQKPQIKDKNFEINMQIC